MTGYTLGTRLLVYGLLAMTFAMGLPLFHYVTAVMIAVVIRHGRGPQGMLARLGPDVPRPPESIPRV